jgi:glutathione S-transferase
VEDGFVLFESFAQSLYLAKAHGLGRLYPEDVRGEALVWQWTFWGLNELEKPLTTCLFERAIKPEDQRDAAAADKAEADLQGPLAVLDRALDGRAWLLGDAFSVADINVAAIAALAKPAKVGLDGNPNVARWLGAALARPAYNG